MLSPNGQQQILVLGFVVCFLSSLGAGQTTVAVDPGTSSLSVGEMTTLNVVVDSVTNLFAAHAVISFDNTKIRSLTVLRGSFLGDPLFFAVSPTPGPSADSLAVDQALLMPGGVSGTGVLFSITYRGVGVGTSPILIASIDLRDQANRRISAITYSGTASVAQGAPVTVQYPASSAWNLLSVPVTLSNPLKSSVFPTAVSDAYSYSPGIGYQIRDTLENGSGYWLKFLSTHNVDITGNILLQDTVVVHPGWNLIGSISDPVAVPEIQEIPPGIVSSFFYSYNGMYTRADTLLPARGYWVKLTQSGQLVLR